MRSKLRTLEALLLLVFWAVAIRIVPIRYALPRHSHESGNRETREMAAHRQAALAVRGAIRSATARLPFKPTCLAQSLAANSMLALRGAPRTLHIGARMQADFEAHAWVETAGLVVAGEGDVASYSSFITSARSRGER